MRARRLQEVYCRFEIRRTLRADKDERHLLSCLTSLFIIVCSWDPIIARLRLKTRKWRRHFFFFRRCHRWVSGATVVVMSETASINIIFAFSFVWILQERVIVALLRRLHRSRWRNLYLCGLWHWRYITKLQCLLSSACWLFFVLHLMTRKRFFALSLRLVPATDNFIMLVMIFSFIGLVWTRCLNFQFRLLLR